MRHSVVVQRRPAWRRPRAALHAVCPIAMKSLRTDDWKQRLQRINGRVQSGRSGLSIDWRPLCGCTPRSTCLEEAAPLSEALSATRRDRPPAVRKMMAGGSKAGRSAMCGTLDVARRHRTAYPSADGAFGASKASGNAEWNVMEGEFGVGMNLQERGHRWDQVRRVFVSGFVCPDSTPGFC